jgi:predicted Zn-dependent protease with MMP-like domain
MGCSHVAQGMGMRPERFDELVEEALERLPQWVKERLDNVVVVVEDDPPREDPNLLGLYEGIPLTARGQDYFGVLPDRIRLFRRTIESVAGNEEDIRREVEETVIHEVAHFFGISDERLHELDWD